MPKKQIKAPTGAQITDNYIAAMLALESPGELPDAFKQIKSAFNSELQRCFSNQRQQLDNFDKLLTDLNKS